MPLWRALAALAPPVKGDWWAAIPELDAQQDGRFLRRCGRGDGVGEIALLRDVPRTATVIAHSPATVYRLSRDAFLTAVLGHAPTHRQAEHIAASRLTTGVEPRGSNPSGAGTTEPAERRVLPWRCCCTVTG